ncbi:MAG: hypothetical protein ACO3E0_07830 [Candidatus Kapaibacteriota bacterium]
MTNETFQFFFATGSWWVIGIGSLLAIAVAWWAYRRTVPDLPQSWRLGLGGLRALGLMLLLLALFEPVMRFVQGSVDRPDVIVAIDASESMQITDERGGRRSMLRDSVLTVLMREAPDHWKFVAFGETVRPVANDSLLNVPDSLPRTSISAVLEWVGNNRRASGTRLGVGAVVLLTDGNDNSEQSVLQVARQIRQPVYSLGIGDTVAPFDLWIDDLILPARPIVGQATTVLARVQHSDSVPRSLNVELRYDNVRLRDTTVMCASGRAVTVMMPWMPRAAGTHSIQAVVRLVAPDPRTEATQSNNTQTSFVEVFDAKRTVVLVAGAPSPDVAYLSSMFGNDPSVDLIRCVQRKGSAFYDRLPTSADIQKAEVCILVGFPTATTPPDVIAAIAKGLTGTNVMFIPSRDVDYRRLGPLASMLPFTVTSSTAEEYLATPDVSADLTSDPILKLTGTEADGDIWNALPPLYRTETFVTPRPGARVLSTIRVQNAPLDEPLLMTYRQGSTRSVALMGYGLYRWELLREGPLQQRGEAPLEVAKLFVGNTTSWLSAKDVEQPVRLATNRMVYAVGDRVGLQATVIDEAGSPIDETRVLVDLQGAGVQRKLVLEGIGAGKYQAAVGMLPPGEYTAKCTAEQQGRVLGSDQRRFLVRPIRIEQAGITMNRSLLEALSQTTSGGFFHARDVQLLIDALQQDPRLQERAVQNVRDTTLWHTPWPLLVALMAFSLEWFLRKRRGLV